MKTVTMLEFRRNAAAVLRRVARGERLILSYRGKPAARLEPVAPRVEIDHANDPFLNIGKRARRSPVGRTNHRDFDKILYDAT